MGKIVTSREVKPRFLLASMETVDKMKEDWNKLYPDKPFSIKAMVSEIRKGSEQYRDL